MTTLAVFSTLIGALLALRYKIFVLVPAIIAGVTVVAITGVARGDAFWLIACSGLIVTVSLQLGFLAGAATAFFLPTRATRSFARGTRDHAMPDRAR